MSILLNIVKILKNSVVVFFEKQKYIVNCFQLNFLSKTLAKYFKIQPFYQKQHEISFFSPLSLHLPEVHSHTPQIQSF